MTERYRMIVGWISIAGSFGLTIWFLTSISSDTSTNKLTLSNNEKTLANNENTLIFNRQAINEGETLLVCSRPTESDGHPALINWPESLEHLTGYTSVEAHADKICMILPDVFKDAALKAEGMAGGGRQMRSVTSRTRGIAYHKDGTEIPVEVATWARSDGASVILKSTVTKVEVE